jgi:uncharacterized peroxidase-related enzyme
MFRKKLFRSYRIIAESGTIYLTGVRPISAGEKRSFSMSRISIPTSESAPAASKPLLDGVYKKLGVVPNVFRLAALSPAALEGLLGLSGPLSRALDVKTRERIAIAVAEENGCDYCLSAHTYLGLNLAKITSEDAALARKGSSTDAKAAAAVRFAVQVASTRGGVSDADIAAVKEAGYSEAQIVEIVALVVENVFTNFLNRVAQTDIDFPVLHTREAA